MSNTKTDQNGFLIIETLIAIVIFSLVAFSLFSTISFLQIRTQKSRYDAEATALAQEGTEIAHNALFADWGGSPSGQYFPAFNASEEDWILLSGKETDLETRFTRYIELIDVCRDTVTGEQIVSFEETNICTGEIDDNSRIIKTVISWQEGDSEKEIITRLLSFKVPDS